MMPPVFLLGVLPLVILLLPKVIDPREMLGDVLTRRERIDLESIIDQVSRTSVLLMVTRPYPPQASPQSGNFFFNPPQNW